MFYYWLSSFLQQHFQWTFSYCIPIFILPATVAGLSIQAFFTQMLKPTTIYCFLIFLCCHYSFRPYDITQHLLTIIIYTFCQYRVEDPDQLARNRYDWLHLLQRILLPRPVIVMDFSKLFILSYHRYRSFIQCISQAFSSPVADAAFSVVFAGTVCNNGISCGVVKFFV